MSSAAKLLSASGGAVDKLHVDDVFQAFTRNGTGADVTVTTGIDMTKGYMLWSKGRLYAADHAIYDSARGVTLDLASNTTASQAVQTTGLKSVSATGHTIGSLAKMNSNGERYVDSVFRKAPKFFDVVTYIGNGVAGRQIPHALGIAPGMVIVKRTDAAGDWYVYHASTGTANYLKLNQTAASATFSVVTATSASNITLPNDGSVNGAGATYIAYLCAHDTSADGIIQCGSYVGTVSAGISYPPINLGWEPQYVLVKQIGAASDWQLYDTSRALTVNKSNSQKQLLANSSSAETTADGVSINASGFLGQVYDFATYIYLAVRRSNKPPTLGTQVYNAIARTGTGAAATVTGVGFAPDMLITKLQTLATSCILRSRLIGPSSHLLTASSNAEQTSNGLLSFDSLGVTFGPDNTGSDTVYTNFETSRSYINHFFKRAVGVFDEVCYTGTGVAKTEAHGLGVVPELMIVKSRGAGQWVVYHSLLGNTKAVQLHLTDATIGPASQFWNDTSPTASVLTLGSAAYMNGSGIAFVAYLFATKAGISKVFSYTGNGTSQTIDCGFTTGARFVMIKATSTTGDWLLGDSTRGLVAGNDPRLSLNTTAAEVTTEDWLDPHSSGFIVNQVAGSNANASGVSYIVLAFA